MLHTEGRLFTGRQLEWRVDLPTAYDTRGHDVASLAAESEWLLLD